MIDTHGRGERAIGPALAGVAGAFAAAASFLPMAGVRVLTSRGVIYPGDPQGPIVQALVSRSAGPEERAVLWLLAGVLLAVALMGIARARLSRTVGVAALTLGVGLGAVAWVALARIDVALAGLAGSYPPFHTPTVGRWMPVGLWSLMLGAIATCLAGVAVLVTAERRATTRADHLLVAGCVVLTVTMLLLTIPSRRMVDGGLVIPLQRTASERSLLLAMQYLQAACVPADTCESVDATFMNATEQPPSQPPITFVDGTTASTANAFPVSIDVAGGARIGLAVLSPAGTCFTMMAPDLVGHRFSYRYGVAPKGDPCTGRDARATALSVSPQRGGWTILVHGDLVWPTVAIGGGGPRILTGA